MQAAVGVVLEVHVTLYLHNSIWLTMLAVDIVTSKYTAH